MQEKKKFCFISTFLGHRSRSRVIRRSSSVVCLSVRPSSVRQFTFSTSSPEPLDRFWWNLVWMKYSRSLTSVVVFRPDPSRGGSRTGQKLVTWVPFFKELLQTGRLQQQTECIAVIYNHVGEVLLIFCSILTSSFWHVLGSCIGHSHFNLFSFKYFNRAKC